jgi:AraC family transcriptional regulator of adaptative response / DNA-3-methyladenine glycosylase II
MASDGARRLFGLDAPVAQARAHLAVDPLIGELVAARPGLRVPGAWDPFELGVRAIVGQQVSVAGASTLIGRLVARWGRPLVPDEGHGLTHLFPPAELLATADLSGLGFTDARARAITSFAYAVAQGEVVLDATVGLEALVASIASLPGLGPWTAHYVALRLGAPDAFPATDLGLRRAVAALSPGGAMPTDLSALAQPWRPWRATAAIHLWLSHPPNARRYTVGRGPW